MADFLISQNRIRGLYAIVDRSISSREDLSLLARDYVHGGAAILQLRDKKRMETTRSRDLFFETARKIFALKKDDPFLFIVNDDLEVAVEIGADGIHVGKDDVSIEDCRRTLGKGKLIGYSSHFLEEAIDAERRGADYVAFGAIYPTSTKGPGHPVQGIERLKEVISKLHVPVVAIGGIGRDNIKEVLATGVPSVAMISALAKGDSPQDRVAMARFFSGMFGFKPR